MVSRATIYTHEAATGRIERYEVQPTRSARAKAYHLIKTGEPFTIQAVAQQVGCTGGALSLLMKTMRSAGYRITGHWVGSTKQFRVTRPPPDYEAAEAVQTARRAAVAAVARDLPSSPPAPYPALGGQLEVRALALDGEGQLAMQLSDGNGRSWRVVVTGHVV